MTKLQFKEMIKQMQRAGKIYLTEEGKTTIKKMGADAHGKARSKKRIVQSI
ncbi:hypothetical protein [Alkalihalobacillus sp. 1P02AB]|uniref:hypothetical protein n=1 Tax=Alkalihalobacillus sp. 1P02AB TaxID=3132260 RepID=UPI0039A5B1C9